MPTLPHITIVRLEIMVNTRYGSCGSGKGYCEAARGDAEGFFDILFMWVKSKGS
jgi:hypothetical protein